jgi:nicotinamide riboside transporter PnuC
MAFQVLFGIFGIALTLLLFVILGNPSAGGAYSASLLPPFWRAISSAIPNGAAVQAIRRVVYFHAYDAAGNILVIAVWAASGAAIALMVSRYHGHQASAQQ